MEKHEIKVFKLEDNCSSLEELRKIIQECRLESIDTNTPILFDFANVKPTDKEITVSKDALDAMAYTLKALAKEGREKYGEGACNLQGRPKTEGS